ncbi:MAG: hypothetical protein KF768_00675 [Phycisphaeraceae bacterium]|nr:hypothetical protein [Phycisphaeraceae bacterium]
MPQASRHRDAHPAAIRPRALAPRMSALVAAPAIALALSACVVDEVRPVSPFETIARANRDAAAAGASRTPGATQTRSTRGGIALLPLGRVRYDGVTLPLTSPDGRWLVAQEGDAPDWSTILAVPFSPDSPPEAEPSPARTAPAVLRLRIYRVFDDRIEPQPILHHVPPGAILGRSCNDVGFLVERPMEDGSRWIGMIRWADGPAQQVSWLVADEHLNAHATLGPTTTTAGSADPQLAWSRQRLGSDRFELVYRPAASDRRGELRASIDIAHVVFPLFFGTNCTIGAAHPGVPPSSVWAIVVPDAESKPSNAPLDLAEFAPAHASLDLAQRTPIAAAGDFLAAYQAVASAQSPAACGTCSGVMVYSAGAACMIYVPSRSAPSAHPQNKAESIVLLDKATFAAIPFGAAPQSGSFNSCAPASALCMSPEGLIEVPLAASLQPRHRDSPAHLDDPPVEFTPIPGLGSPPIPVKGTLLLPGVFVPRSTTHADGRLLLLAPPIKGEDSVLDLHLAARAEPVVTPGAARQPRR